MIMSISAMTMAMLLTGAGEVQPSSPPPITVVPMAPPPPITMVPVAPPAPPAPPPLRPPGTPGAYPYPILAAPQPPPLHPPVPRPPGAPPERRRANLNSYISADDYPAAALRGNEEGVTEVRLTISPEGRVSDCTVSSSSGSSSLDQATCRILRSRARYTPALDAAGQPTSGRDIGRIRWTLPNTE